MNHTPLPPSSLPGFKVVPKRRLAEAISPAQSAYVVLLGRRGSPDAPRERVLFVHYLDHVVEGCEQHIERLWRKHRVFITHVAVKLGRRPAAESHSFADVYRRAISLQQLRDKLQPRFRRL